MAVSRYALPAIVVLVGSSPASAFETRDRVLIDLAGIGFGPGIPSQGEGLALGGSLGAYIQEDEGDVSILLRPALVYVRAISGWADDEHTMDLGGLSLSVGIGISDLGRALPYVEAGFDPTLAFVRSADEDRWDWSLGIHADFGVSIALGEWLTIRPAIGFQSLLFSDLDTAAGGLRFSLGLGFDPDPYEEWEPEPESGFYINASNIEPGVATVWITRNGDFADPVGVWVEPSDGYQAVVLPDPASGADHYRVLVRANPGWCNGFNLRVRGSGGGVEQTYDLSMTPSCPGEVTP